MKKSLFVFCCLIYSSVYTQQIALNFAGDNDWITGTNTGLPQGNNPRTIETWIKYSTSRNDMSIFNYGTFAFNQKFTLHLYNGVYIIGEGNDLATGYNFNDGNWHHLAVTHNGTTTIVYVDGVVRGSRNTTYNTTGYDYQMGVSYRGGNWDFRYEGTIDELRVWNVARTQQEIIDNMHINFNSAPGLIALYHLNDGIPNGNNTGISTVADATGNGNHGTLNNFALTGTISNFVNDAILLPLRLLDFSLKQVDCNAIIQWQTTDEHQIRLYEIEASTDGFHFLPVHQQLPKNAPGANTYKVTLPVQNGHTYYRLKTTELSQKVSYSSLLSFQGSGCTKQISIQPNPATHFLTITSQLPGQEYRIYNSAGLLIQTAVLKTGYGKIDISKYSPGLYFLTVAGNRAVAFVKD